jgi:2-polyprenyl-6-hydroxyphenyl methylase/3-demethylubiquinone-9 3-methyltransferase
MSDTPTMPSADRDPARIDPAEVAKFEAMADEWWDPQGKFKPLHLLNPTRLDYISRQIAAEFDRDLRAPSPLRGLTLLDVGAGGGLVAEPMARLGATVTGIDASPAARPVADLHAARGGLEIDYRTASAEDLVAAGETFDAVLALEIIEHVPDPAAFVQACAALVRPGGMVILSTLNRTGKSFAAAIVGAEWIMGWLPRGTHDWSRFVTPDELGGYVTGAGLEPVDRKGMVFDPFRWTWSLSETDLSVNYLCAAVRPA